MSEVRQFVGGCYNADTSVADIPFESIGILIALLIAIDTQEVEYEQNRLNDKAGRLVGAERAEFGARM